MRKQSVCEAGVKSTDAIASVKVRRERTRGWGRNDGHVLMVGVSFTDSFLVLEGKSLFLFLDSSFYFVF